jgi:hypothetical protein
METTDFSETPQAGLNQARSFVGGAVEQQTRRAGARMGAVANDIHNVGDQLRQNPALGTAADYVHRGADMVAGLGRYLQDANVDRLLGDMEAVVRRQPWAFASGALIAGFAAARFLKTSSARRYRGGEGYAI